MPAKKLKTLTPEEQSALFAEAAKKAESDESGKSFEKAFKKIVVSKNGKSLGVGSNKKT
jgi:hypothetical protein